jgi:O-antigen ligase
VVVSFEITERELKAVILMTIAGGLIASAYALREFAHGTGWFSRASLVIAGHEANPNDFADSLLLPLTLALGFFFSRTGVKRAASLGAALVIAFCVLSTMSRGSMVAVGVALLFYLFRIGIRPRTLLVIVLIAASVTFLPNLFFTRVQDSASSHAEGRWDILIVGTQIVNRYGIFGVGMDNFRAAYNKFVGFAPVFRGYARDPHDIYLQVWAETGIVGLAFFLLAIGTQMKDLIVGNFRRASPDYIMLSIETGCWALLIHGFAANLLWRKQFWLAWMLAALVLQLHRNVAEREKAIAHVVQAEARHQLLPMRSL